VAWDQQQVVDCSHLLVFAAWDDITADRVNAVYDQITEERGPNEGLDAYRQRLLGIVAARGKEANYEAAARQAYIGLGAALIAAAFEGVDATPMEGFDPAAVDAILGLQERHLRSVLIVPLGYRDEEGDWLLNMKKVRRPRDQFVTEMH
jgi:nitroreductase/dihydropteridine reductase